MKKFFAIAALAAAMLVSFSSCKKDNPEDASRYVYANDFSKSMPNVLEVSLADAGYYSKCAFVPFDGKAKLKYGADNNTSLKITIEPAGSIFWAGVTAEKFSLEGWAFGFAASAGSKVGDQATATIAYNYEGVSIQKTVTIKVVD